jgi:hypothetical protein
MEDSLINPHSPADVSVTNCSCTALFVEKTYNANGFGRSRMILIASSTPLTYTITTRDNTAFIIFGNTGKIQTWSLKVKSQHYVLTTIQARTYEFKQN